MLPSDQTLTGVVSCNACGQGLGGKPGSSAKFWNNVNDIVQAALTAPNPCVQAYETQDCVYNCPSDPYGPTSGMFHFIHIACSTRILLSPTLRIKLIQTDLQQPNPSLRATHPAGVACT